MIVHIVNWKMCHLKPLFVEFIWLRFIWRVTFASLLPSSTRCRCHDSDKHLTWTMFNIYHTCSNGFLSRVEALKLATEHHSQYLNKLYLKLLSMEICAATAMALLCGIDNAMPCQSEHLALPSNTAFIFIGWMCSHGINRPWTCNHR